FTGREDILLLVNAVVMDPLRREWAKTRETVSCLLDTGKKKRDGKNEKRELNSSALKKARMESSSLLHGYLVRLQSVKVLDPACGSGNFLYVTLQALKDLEKEVIVFSMDNGLGSFIPLVGPWQLYGIELNPYAHDLAQMTVWIGWLQWLKFNGFGSPQEPILRAIPGNFQCRDAIMNVVSHEGAEKPSEITEPDWPVVDFIVGNPPFLGGNRIRSELGDTYVENLFRLYKDRVPAFADLCCYWFEKARAHIKAGKCKRAGLLATQGIRGGANREVLKRIKDSGDIFWAVSDRDWIQDGANVHVSMAAFDNGIESKRILNGQTVSKINPDLTSSADVTSAMILAENQGICFMGPSAKAPFDIDSETAGAMLSDTGNPNGRPNSDVVRPVVSAVDIGQASRGKWTIDFALMPLEEAAKYEKPFEYVKTHVYPVRSQNRREAYAQKWWQYAEARPGMRKALTGLKRYIATPGVSKHRLFVWMTSNVLCNQGTLVFARDDDMFFGILHSRIHEVWARAQGTQLREEESGCRYTPTTSFETFPLPCPTPEQAEAIGVAARELVEQRDRWLKPESATPAELKNRTLTNLYNARPTWLDLAHKKLDAAVAAVYSFASDLSDEQILSRLLKLNHERA
ncbi:MAG: DNA methyltransferase, partial [bacterium]